MLVKVKFKVKSIFGAKGEERTVSGRAAEKFLRKGLIEPFKEEVIPEVKKEDTELDKKEEVIPDKKVKVTTSPKEEVKVTDKKGKGSKTIK